MGINGTQMTMSIENVVIVGSGPAGYTAAIYAARANLQPLLVTGFQSGGIPGGQLMTTTHVENFPGFPDGVMGPELMDLMKAQALRWGTKLFEADVELIDLQRRPFRLKAAGSLIESHALIIATGASANRLGLPSEERFWGRGISACAICDGATPQFRQEDLAVIGGGDSACEEAVYLTKYGSHVHLLVRSKSFRASAAMVERVMANTLITVHWRTEVLDVEGDEWLSRLKIRSLDSKEEQNISVKGLFYAIGHTPNSKLLAGKLNLDSKGYIRTKEGRPETSIEGVFAAGDVADSEWRQGITAAASGCKAALAAERWLGENKLEKLIQRKDLEPAKAIMPQSFRATPEKDFKHDALWQSGSYALRKLYHESDRPLLVIYTSINCGPCHVLKPQLRRVIEEYEGKVLAIEIDIEIDQEIAEQANVNGTPMVHLFKNKELIKQWKGVKQRADFKKIIDDFL